jgi:LysR family hydrogen peroxide-inducible transcriptional activator
MVASRVGITVLPASAAREDRLGGQVVCARPFAGRSPTRTVALAWRKSFPRLAAVEAVAAAVRAAPLGDGIVLRPAAASDASS